MQKKGKKTYKRITALVLCAILLVTSLPLALAAGDSYDPVPVFTAAAREQGAAAWMNDEGGIVIRFPSAEARGETWNGATKTIQFYLLRLVDLGDLFSLHTEEVKLSKIYTPAAGATSNEIVLDAAEIEAAVGGALDSSHRYSVSIQAVDSESWFSEPITTIVSDVPEYVYDAEAYAPLVEYDNAMREMMRFESRTSETNYSSAGDGSGKWDLIQVGDSITTAGIAEQTGAEDPATQLDTYGYRIRINRAPTEGVGQSFDTAWSRETWDYDGAEEIWFWLDLSQVDLKGLSFRLRANEKSWQDFGGYNASRKSVELDYSKADQYSSVVYSTLGYTGNDAYVLVQQTDGSWKKVMLENGTIDLGHFRGYVRVPLQFICSETPSYVQISNQDMSQGYDFTVASGWFDYYHTVPDLSKDSDAKTWMYSLYYTNADGSMRNVLVDDAGTPVSDALLLQRRGSYYQRQQSGTTESWWSVTWMKSGVVSESVSDNSDVNMLAVGLDVDEVNDGNAAYINMNADGSYTIENTENAYKAIDDIMSAGFAYTGIGSDSVDKSIFLDNILFYRTDNQPYSENSVNNVADIGKTVATYYDQKATIQGVILDAIDKYISDPDYSDYRQVAYIEDLIAGYVRAFDEFNKQNGTNISTAFLNMDPNATDGLVAGAAALGRSATWEKFVAARDACAAEGTLGKNNSEPADLVPTIVRKLEKIPDIDETVVTIDDAYVSTVIELYQAYRRLNLAQLRALGKAEEQKLIVLFNLVRDKLGENTVPVGQKLADYPFIPFNTFEENTTLGERAWQLENDPSFSSTSDYRHTKGLVTYSTSEGKDLTTLDRGINYSVSLGSRTDAMWANITTNGYNGSHGLTATVDSSFSCTQSSNWLTSDATPDGTMHVVTVSRNSQSANDYASFAANNMSSVKLSELAHNMSDDDFKAGVYMPLSLVFYVDFSDLSDDFLFCVNMFTKDADGNDVRVRPDMGAQIAIGSNTWWRSFYLLNEETGEWQRVYGDSRYYFNSTSVQDANVNLKNYRGYIAIPLHHFKMATTGNNQNKVTYPGNSAMLDNIFAIQIAVGGASMDHKTFTIDNIGFTYDPSFYSTSVQESRTDTSYAEQFGATSLPAEQFCDAVAAIDIYNATNLAEQVEQVEALYSNLHPYQQTLDAVVKANELLKKYRSYVDNPSELLEATSRSITPANLLARLEDEAYYPAAAKNAVLTGEGDLPKPLFTTNADGTTEVDYANYGLTAERANEIIQEYEKGYSRFSASEKEQFTAEQKTALMTAYYAARRCVVTQEANLSQANAYYTNLENGAGYTQPGMPVGYVPSDDTQTSCISIKNRDALYALFIGSATADTTDITGFADINYYAKYAIGVGDINGIAPKAGTGLYMWLQNTQTVLLTDGTQIDSGVLKLQTDWENLYREASEKIQNKEILSEDLLNSLENAVDYYNNLDDTYRNTTELSDAINAILKLFPVDAVSLDKDTIMLNSETLSDTATYKVEYSEQLPVPTADSELNYITITSANGALAADTFTADYNVTLTAPDGTVYSKKASDLTTEFKVGTVANNAATPSTPQSLQIAVSLDEEILFTRGSLTDTLTVKYYNANGDAITDENGNPIEKTVTVMYSMTNAYIVTIPADIEIDWGDTSPYDAYYTVNTSFGGNASIDVSVADNTADPADLSSYKLTDANSNTLTYSPTNFGTENFSGSTNGVAVKPEKEPAVSVSDWSGVPVSEYRTTLTYTVTYHSGN